MNILVKQLNDANRNDGFEDRLNKCCGANTGNLVWYHYGSETFDYDKEISLNSIKVNNDDTYILLMANDINVVGNCIEKYGKCLEGFTKGKFVIMGLGCQLTSEINTPKKLVNALAKTEIKCLKNISEHTNKIGIRGNITAEVLDLLGIHNYQVIGCPSFYSLSDENAEKLSDMPVDKPDLVFNTISLGNPYEHYLLELILQNKNSNASLIMQSIRDLPKTIFYNKHLEKNI